MGGYHVLVSSPLIQEAIDDYAERLAAHDITYDVPAVDQQLTEAELVDIIDRYDAVIAGDDELTARVLEAATDLELIVKWGIGVDNIDLDAARERGIAVENTPGAFGSEVAGVVMGYTLMLTRQLHRVDRAVRSGEWFCPRGRSLAGKTFGVVGAGNTGSAVARRAVAFETDVVCADIEPLPENLQEQDAIERVSHGELFERSDVVSLHCPLTSETRGMVDEVALDAIGSEGYLVNTARGDLVDEPALVEALREGRIAGAALDVFATEPLPADHPLTELDNVVLGSHNAQNTVEAVRSVNDRAVDILVEELTGDE